MSQASGPEAESDALRQVVSAHFLLLRRARSQIPQVLSVHFAAASFTGEMEVEVLYRATAVLASVERAA